MAESKLEKSKAGAKKDFSSKSPAGGAHQSCEYTWIEIELVDRDGDPVPYEPYKITLPDNKVVRGRLDENGFARVGGLHVSGTCQISFTEIHRECWARA